MLAIQKQSKFIQKKIQLPNGSWALVVFELREVNGKITAKAVSGQLLETPIAAEEILALPIYIEKQNIAPIISPYFSEIQSLVKDFSFVLSQPTRAPAFL